jgi:DNA-binding LacI/PurR family transcriptional regulator
VPSPKITLRSIARSLGISHVTVSRALHDNPRISLKRRRQIQAEAARLGYSPNPSATALGHQRQYAPRPSVSGEIAWINCWPDPKRLRSFREFDLYWRGAYKVAEQCGYRLEEFSCNQQMPLARLEKIFLTRNIRGILVPPVPASTEEWIRVNWDPFCVIRFGYTLTKPDAHIVTSDQLSNSLIAFEHIRRLGYARIGFVSGAKITTHFKAGFLMKQLDVPPSERVPLLLLPEHSPHLLDTRLFLPWLREHRPDAILTDLAQMRTMLAENGYSVPKDIGLATLSVLDGEADAGIYQNSEEIGKAAMELLISLLNHHHYGTPPITRELLVKGRWVDGSTLPPRP